MDALDGQIAVTPLMLLSRTARARARLLKKASSDITSSISMKRCSSPPNEYRVGISVPPRYWGQWNLCLAKIRASACACAAPKHPDHEPTSDAGLWWSADPGCRERRARPPSERPHRHASCLGQ